MERTQRKSTLCAFQSRSRLSDSAVQRRLPFWASFAPKRARSKCRERPAEVRRHVIALAAAQFCCAADPRFAQGDTAGLSADALKVFVSKGPAPRSSAGGSVSAPRLGSGKIMIQAQPPRAEIRVSLSSSLHCLHGQVGDLKAAPSSCWRAYRFSHGPSSVPGMISCSSRRLFSSSAAAPDIFKCFPRGAFALFRFGSGHATLGLDPMQLMTWCPPARSAQEAGEPAAENTHTPLCHPGAAFSFDGNCHRVDRSSLVMIPGSIPFTALVTLRRTLFLMCLV